MKTEAEIKDLIKLQDRRIADCLEYIANPEIGKPEVQDFATEQLLLIERAKKSALEWVLR